jgi:hypothetical protein
MATSPWFERWNKKNRICCRKKRAEEAEEKKKKGKKRFTRINKMNHHNFCARLGAVEVSRAHPRLAERERAPSPFPPARVTSLPRVVAPELMILIFECLPCALYFICSALSLPLRSELFFDIGFYGAVGGVREKKTKPQIVKKRNGGGFSGFRFHEKKLLENSSRGEEAAINKTLG